MDRVIKFPLTTLLFIFLIAGFAVSQEQSTMPFDHIDMDRGRAPVSVHAIVQDVTGYLWFSTGGELHRFDGHSLTTYEHDPKDRGSICDGLLYVLKATPDGSVWVGTREGKVCRFDQGNQRFVHYGLPVPVRESTEGISLESLLVDRTGGVWVTTSGGGVYRFNESTNSFTRYELNTGPDRLHEATVMQAFEGSDGAFWLSIRGFGLAHMDRGGTGSLKDQFQFEALVPIRSASDAWMVEGTAGQLLVGTRAGGLFSLDPERRVLTLLLSDALGELLSDTAVACVLVDKRGKLWFGTRGNGVVMYDQGTGAMEHFRHDPAYPGSIDSNNIRYIYQDRSETVWIATDRGLNAQNRFKYKFHGTFTPLPVVENEEEDQVVALQLGGTDHVWVSTLQYGIRQFDKDLRRINPVVFASSTGPARFTAFSILETSPGKVFFGSANDGLLAFERASGELKSITKRQQITDLLLDRSGSVWFATREDGLGRYDAQSDSVLYWTFWDAVPGGRLHRHPTALLEDRRGNIWIGTDGAGLHVLSTDRKNYQHFRNDSADADSLCDDRITCLYEDESGMIWIGTRGGLSRYDPGTAAFTNYRAREALPDDYICGIAPGAEGEMWLSTTKGLVRFMPAIGGSVLFDARNGVHGYPFTTGVMSVSESGEVFVGGMGGISRFQPQELTYNPYRPKVILTAFHKLNKEVTFGMPLSGVDQIGLKHDENFFSFEFASLDFADPSRNRYRYMLEGVDAGWIDSSTRRFANYTKIPPGSYVFRVHGSNNDGVWSDVPAKVSVVIAPPFWATWQFRLLSAMLVFALVVVAYKVRTNSIKRQRDRLQQEVNERREVEKKLRANRGRLRSLTSQLTLVEEKERRRISQQLHDRIGHALLMTKVGLTAHAKGDKTAAERHPYGTIIETVNTAMQDARSLSVEISPPSLHKFGLEPAAESLIERFGEQYGLTTVVSWSEHSPISDDVAVILYQALRELLVNIIKHAEAKTVQVAIENDGSDIILSVQDDGLGFDVELMTDDNNDFKGYGLFSINERAESIGGKMHVQSSPNEGTIITLRAPLVPPTEDIAQ